MGSGKYGAVSGMLTRMKMMDNISEHMAAVKTYSYKKGVPTFEARLAEANSGMATKGVNYARISGEAIDFSPGELEASGSPLHLAINGDGFFQVQLDDGTMAYTRKGGFRLNPEGFLIDSADRKIMGTGGNEILLPSPNVEISPDGSIWHDGAQVGHVGVFKFEDNSILKRAGAALFAPSDGSEPELDLQPQVAQYNLETSNVDMMKTTVRMTANLRAFEAMQKALKIYSEMGNKGAEIGLVQ
jgi:flagellar basal body rod protein FlgG